MSMAMLFTSSVCVFLFWPQKDTDSQVSKPGMSAMQLLATTSSGSQASKPDNLPASRASGTGNDTGAYYATAFDGVNFWAARSAGRLVR